MSRWPQGDGEASPGLGPEPGGRKRGWQPGRTGPATGTECTVQIKLELGHHAQLREKPTPEGFNHDWMVFVRGPEQSEIQHFVEKVVFRLNQCFPNPKRVCKDPPYQVEESSNEGFIMPIEIYLKNKGEPKRVCLTYDLSLNQKGNLPLDHVHYEELTFNNPTKEFRRKLIKAGGVISESAVSDPKKIKPSHESK